MENLEELNNKTDHMRGVAKKFKKHGKELERLMYYRNMKVNCIIFFMVLMVVLYFTFPYIWQWIQEMRAENAK